MTMATLAGSIAISSKPSLVILNLASVTKSEIIEILSLKNRGSAKTSFICKYPLRNFQRGAIYKICCSKEAGSYLKDSTSLKYYLLVIIIGKVYKVIPAVNYNETCSLTIHFDPVLWWLRPRN